MRNDTTDDLGRRLSQYFLRQKLSVDEFLNKLKAECTSVVSIQLAHQVPSYFSDKEDATETYATVHFIYEGAVVSAFTWPDKGPDWYCKY